MRKRNSADGDSKKGDSSVNPVKNPISGSIKKLKKISAGKRGRPSKTGGSISNTDLYEADSLSENLDGIMQEQDNCAFLHGYIMGMNRFVYVRDDDY